MIYPQSRGRLVFPARFFTPVSLPNHARTKSRLTLHPITAGHVHDGGMYTTIELNGKTVCKSDQLYGRTPQYIAAGGGHGGHKAKRDGGGGAHISDAGICVNFGTIKKGDTLTVTAHYDTVKYPLMASHDGGKESIMGISRVLIGASSTSGSSSSGGLFGGIRGGSLLSSIRGN